MGLFADTIAYFQVSGGITVRSFPAGTSVKGQYTAGAPVDVTGVVASAQPLTGKELAALPEGMRSRRNQKFHTETVLNQEDSVAGTLADQIIWNGDTFELVKVEKHTHGGYYEGIGVKLGQ